MKCVNCGNEIIEGNQFCSSCGAKVELHPEPTNEPVPATTDVVAPAQYYNQPPKKNTGLKIAIIIMAIIILVGVGIGIWLLVKDNGGSDNNSNNSNNAVENNTNNNNSGGGGTTGEKFICSATVEGDMTYEERLIGYHKNNKMYKIEAEMEFEDEESANYYYSFIELYNSMSEDKANAKQEGKIIKISNAEVLIRDEGDPDEGIEGFEPIGMDKDEFLEYVKSEGMTCK